MISSFRNFAKTKFAGILVFLMIIPFVFWGMGGMFSSGNTNTIAKIDKTNISTQEFIDYINNTGIAEKTIQENLDNNIIEELLSGLVSTTLLDLEIKDFNINFSENSLSKKIRSNKNFIDENNVFQRIKYEKFLLENNTSAPIFEKRLKDRELQKKLFDFIGAGTVPPQFLITKLFETENRKLDIDFIHLSCWDAFSKSISFPDDNRTLTQIITESYNKLPTIISTGGVWSSVDAQNLLKQGADLVGVGRVAIGHPYWANNISNINYNPKKPPFTTKELEKSKLNHKFISYMKNWDNFVINE